jgi:hypothetical protein
MKRRPDCPKGDPAAARIRAAKTEIEVLLRQLVSEEELKVFAYRWGLDFLDSGRQLCKLDLYFEDQPKSLSFDYRDLRDREPGFWRSTVQRLLRQEAQQASA